MINIQKLRFFILQKTSLFLAVVLIFILLPPTAVALEANYYDGISRDKVYERISTALEEQKNIIDIKDLGLSAYALSKYLSLILKNEPGLFFVERSIKYDLDDRGLVTYITPKYNMSREEAVKAIEFCENEINKILFLLDDGMNDYDKALFLHDYICTRFSYDTMLQYDDMYEFLKHGKGTCQGYTFTYMALLRAAGVECSFAASDTIVHIWNLVKLDGEWYHVDLTWDDAVDERLGYVEHENFLCSDTEARNRGHRDWYSPDNIVCSSEKYDGIFTDYINTAFAYHDGRWYCADNAPHSRSLSLFDPESGIATSLIKTDSMWNKGNTAEKYISSCISVCALGGLLYYNDTCNIYAYNTRTGDKKILLSTPDGTQIYRIELRDGKIAYSCTDDYSNISAVQYCDPIYPERGDLNGDGKINGRDVSLLRIYIEMGNTDLYKFAADVDGNSLLDDADVEGLRKMIVENSYD